jgi:hypothetical protein
VVNDRWTARGSYRTWVACLWERISRLRKSGASNTSQTSGRRCSSEGCHLELYRPKTAFSSEVSRSRQRPSTAASAGHVVGSPNAPRPLSTVLRVIALSSFVPGTTFAPRFVLPAQYVSRPDFSVIVDGVFAVGGLPGRESFLYPNNAVLDL